MLGQFGHLIIPRNPFVALTLVKRTFEQSRRSGGSRVEKEARVTYQPYRGTRNLFENAIPGRMNRPALSACKTGEKQTLDGK